MAVSAIILITCLLLPPSTPVVALDDEDLRRHPRRVQALIGRHGIARFLQMSTSEVLPEAEKQLLLETGFVVTGGDRAETQTNTEKISSEQDANYTMPMNNSDEHAVKEEAETLRSLESETPLNHSVSFVRRESMNATGEELHPGILSSLIAIHDAAIPLMNNAIIDISHQPIWALAALTWVPATISACVWLGPARAVQEHHRLVASHRAPCRDQITR